MKKRIRPLIFTSVLIMMIGAIFFAGKPEPTAGQITGRERPCSCHCEGTTFHGKNDYRTINKQPCTGLVSSTECWKEIELIPDGTFEEKAAKKDKLDSICKTIRAQPGFTTIKDSCPTFSPYCPEDEKKPKCEPPSRIAGSPWLDPDVPCGKRERGVVSWKDILGTRNQAYTVKMCGEIINYTLVNGAGRGKVRRPPGVRGFDVCCERWLSALNSKSPCDVRKDIDCDGEINEEDRFPDFSEEDTRRGSDLFVMKAPPWPKDAGSLSDPPWNHLHAPDQSECKDCKWELIAYEFTTKKIPNRGVSDSSGEPRMDTEYRFKTLWKCPINGQTKENYEVVTVEATRTRLPHDLLGPRN